MASDLLQCSLSGIPAGLAWCSDPVEERGLCQCCCPSLFRSLSAGFDLDEFAFARLNRHPFSYDPYPYLPYSDCPYSFRPCLARLFLQSRLTLSLSSRPCWTYLCPLCLPSSYRPCCPSPCPPSCALDAGPSEESRLPYPSWEQACHAHRRYDLQVAQRWCKPHRLEAARLRRRSRQHQCGIHPL